MAVGRFAIAAVLVAAGALTSYLAAFGWRNRHEVGADWFAATMGVNTLWVAFDLAKLVVAGRSAHALLAQGVSSAATVVPVFWFCFVLAYTGRGRLLDWRGLALLWALPTGVVSAILTTGAHDLYFASLSYSTGAGPTGPVLEAQPGPVAWLNLAYFAVLVSVGLWLVVRMLWEHDRLYSRQAVWLLVGTLAPVGLLAVSLLLDLPASLPVISLGFSVLGLAYAHGLFAHHLLDLSPAPRRIGIPEAFDDLGEGVVVVDVDLDVVAINDRACELFDCRKAAVLGRPLAGVSPVLEPVDSRSEGDDVSVGSRTLSVSGSTVEDARGHRTGHALVVRDVTEQRRREQRLDVLSRVFRHNIRNSMNAVVGPAAVLADRLDGTDAQAAETVLEAGEDVVVLSEKVRTVEEMMTGPVSVTDVPVEPLVDGVVASVTGQLDRTDGDPLGLDVTVPTDLTVRTDPEVLAVVLENVVENAVEHGVPNDDGSDPDRDVSRSDRPSDAEARDPRVRVTVQRRNGGCLIHVTDDGPGIPAMEVDVLRAGAENALEHASGLGLWAIHWGVTRLEGGVGFADADGGTRVTLWIPDLTDAVAPPPRDAVDPDGEWLGTGPAVADTDGVAGDTVTRPGRESGGGRSVAEGPETDGAAGTEPAHHEGIEDRQALED